MKAIFYRHWLAVKAQDRTEGSKTKSKRGDESLDFCGGCLTEKREGTFTRIHSEHLRTGEKWVDILNSSPEDVDSGSPPEAQGSYPGLGWG